MVAIRPLSAFYWISLIRTLVHGSSQFISVMSVCASKIVSAASPLPILGGGRIAFFVLDVSSKCSFEFDLIQSISRRSTFEEE